MKKDLRVRWEQNGEKRERFKQSDTETFAIQIDECGNLLIIRDGEVSQGVIITTATDIVCVLSAATRWSVEYV